MVRKRISLWIVACFFVQITACSTFIPVQRHLAQPVSCMPNVHENMDGLLLDNGLICSSASIPHAFPVITRTIPNLEYPLFSIKRRNTGLDNPVSFWRRGCAGLYQIASAPAKLVVIYINGYNGRPTGWKRIFAELQELAVTHIFFNYPTGDSLETTAVVLSELLRSNAPQLQGKSIVLLGHSQGGFIAIRTTQLLSQQASTPTISHIVTIVTPWDGCKLAKYAKLVNPLSPRVFEDIDTDSAFIHQVKARALPSTTKYTLIYGSTLKSHTTDNPNDELFSVKNQLATGSTITPTSTHCVITSHSKSLRANGVSELIKKYVEQCLITATLESH